MARKNLRRADSRTRGLGCIRRPSPHSDRPGDVLDLVRARILETLFVLSLYLFVDVLRNVLSSLHRQRGLDLQSAIEIASDAELFMQGREFVVASRPVLELSGESGRSAYDCEFVALALQEEARLVTSDRALAQAFPGIALSPVDFAAGA